MAERLVCTTIAIFRPELPPPNGGVECMGLAKISILNEYLALRSVTAAPWLVYGNLRPGFC